MPSAKWLDPGLQLFAIKSCGLDVAHIQFLQHIESVCCWVCLNSSSELIATENALPKVHFYMWPAIT